MRLRNVTDFSVNGEKRSGMALSVILTEFYAIWRSHLFAQKKAPLNRLAPVFPCPGLEPKSSNT